MRLLLDESLPRRLRDHLPRHLVRTVVEMGWGGIKNGKLLALAGQQFDVFLTADKNLPYQQNLSTLPLSVVVLDARSNELLQLLPLIPNLEDRLANLMPRSYARVAA